MFVLAAGNPLDEFSQQGQIVDLGGQPVQLRPGVGHRRRLGLGDPTGVHDHLLLGQERRPGPVEERHGPPAGPSPRGDVAVQLQAEPPRPLAGDQVHLQPRDRLAASPRPSPHDHFIDLLGHRRVRRDQPVDQVCRDGDSQIGVAILHVQPASSSTTSGAVDQRSDCWADAMVSAGKNRLLLVTLQLAQQPEIVDRLDGQLFQFGLVRDEFRFVEQRAREGERAA